MFEPDRTHDLDYAPRAAGDARRKFLRRATRAIFALAISTALIAVAVRTVRQVLYLRVQQECMTYIASPDRLSETK